MSDVIIELRSAQGFPPSFSTSMLFLRDLQDICVADADLADPDDEQGVRLKRFQQ